MKIKLLLTLTTLSLALTGCSTNKAPGKSAEGNTATAPNDARPTLYLIGDSTVNNSGKGQLGWGKPIAHLFDTNRINVVNRARGGRSSRTYYTEGLWADVEKDLKPGDFVLMQFGHNDGGGVGPTKTRASVKGVGDETVTVTSTNGVTETVHTYGWYLRQYVSGAKAKGATPIVLSLIPRNIWKDGKVGRASNDYGKWAKEVAQSEGVQFVDLNAIVANHYDEIGETNVAANFFGPTDHTHTTSEGAEFNARCVVEGIREHSDSPLKNYLRD
jgi:lysophospholipase L1-like esterase